MGEGAVAEEMMICRAREAMCRSGAVVERVPWGLLVGSDLILVLRDGRSALLFALLGWHSLDVVRAGRGLGRFRAALRRRVPAEPVLLSYVGALVGVGRC